VALILDTNAISALSAQEDALLNILEPGAELCVTVVNAAEYFYGIQNSKKKIVLTRWFAEFLEGVEILDLNREVFPFYHAIRTELKMAGTPIPANDLWTASLARLHGMKVVSRDLHFDRVQGLERVAW
jgi:predicted nucleic acid-binding protein